MRDDNFEVHVNHTSTSAHLETDAAANRAGEVRRKCCSSRIMVYISNGNVSTKPTGLIPLAKAYVFALINFFVFFFQSLLSPDAASKQNVPDRRKPGGGSGGGGYGGRARITGLDNISGSSHAAQCGGGG
ncbi:hypothetical protein CEUSTIGMA_g4612.t1 [Chlamydomonas eustigma]|uniref:Uncharacterized protein n=1 Tax=Chlamydomonas eustigma TaxID=1157962 RepID=A0A250X261_9CHLO|nr:hypothetical protein CEUSTIGMA_g4612.t1 [Chlamydomonas eustigma]|eukprot:GAX77167.1 hypothetical protein CEUSTIGMA_g4612.t1 [Chlamydomonas eustigma]